MISIGAKYGITSIYGSILASGLFVIIISTFFGKLVRFFPPVVTGSVVTIIGITLIPVAMNNMAGGEGSADYGSMDNLLLAFGTLIFILVLYKMFTGFIRSVSILLGLVAGTIAAMFMGKVNFSEVGEASWFHMAQPFYFGMPAFHIAAILPVRCLCGERRHTHRRRTTPFTDGRSCKKRYPG